MQIPKDARRKARELYDAALDASGRPDPVKTLAVADLLLKTSPRRTLQILKEYTRLIRLATEKHHALIESATPLDETTWVAIVKSLRLRDGGEVSLETRVTPALIGGTRIRLGSEVWDATLSARIQNLSSAVS